MTATTESVPELLGTSAAASPNPVQQWWALTGRGVQKIIRNGEVIFAFVSPALLGVCFYIPLRKLVDGIGYDYGQFLMPIIMLQSMAFVATSAAMRSALDGHQGVHERFRVLPMPAVIPMLARTATNCVLLVVALGCGLVVCLIIGWRPLVEDGGPGWRGAGISLAIVAVVGLLLALVCDAIGLVANSPQATSQLIAFPTMILGMLSTGFIPLAAFPEWIRGFAKNQPISKVTSAMRSAEDGTLTWHSFAPTLYWCVGIVALAAVLFAISVRRATR